MAAPSTAEHEPEHGREGLQIQRRTRAEARPRLTSVMTTSAHALAGSLNVTAGAPPKSARECV